MSDHSFNRHSVWKKAKKVLGRKDAPDSPRVAGKHTKQTWGLEDQERWVRQDEVPAMLAHNDSSDSHHHQPQQDDWYSAALQQSAQLAELAKEEEAEHRQWVEQEQSTREARPTERRLRHRATPVEQRPRDDAWFKAALEQSAQLESV